MCSTPTPELEPLSILLLHKCSIHETMGAHMNGDPPVHPEQAIRLGAFLRERREALGLSSREIARRTGINDATLSRLERGEFAAPRPDKLSKVAEALGIPLADVFALADYVVPEDLPTPSPYFRARYRDDLTPDELDQMTAEVNQVLAKFGVDHADGPAPGEDET